MTRERDRAALRAALYAAVHRGTPGDVELHLRECAGARRVLELGCGAGRIALALAEAGHEVVGVEIDRELLTIARAAVAASSPEVQRRIELREGDARALEHGLELELELELGEARFDRVILAHSTIYCFLDDAERRAVLRGVRAHLAPGGRLVIDAYAADGFHAALDPGAPDDFEEVAQVTAAGRRWRVLERSDWDRDAQRLDAHYRHEPLGGGRAIETTIAHRYLLAAELEGLLRDEGFAHVRLEGDLEGAPFTAESEHLVAIASA